MTLGWGRSLRPDATWRKRPKDLASDKLTTMVSYCCSEMCSQSTMVMREHYSATMSPLMPAIGSVLAQVIA